MKTEYFKDLKQNTKVKKTATVLLVAVLGLSLGFTVSQGMESPQQGETYCNSIESKVVEERNISGTLACFEPDLVQVNLSEKVENNSELRCVCRQEYRGLEQIIPISVSN